MKTTRYFENCHTAEELKKTYRKWAKKLHPDFGGDAEEFKAMQAEYEALTKGSAQERARKARARREAEEAARKAAEEKARKEAARKAAEEKARKEAARKAAEEKARKAEGGMPKRVEDAIRALQNAGFEAGYHRRTYLWVNWPGAGKVRVNCLKSGEFKFSYGGKVFAEVKDIEELIHTLNQ